MDSWRNVKTHGELVATPGIEDYSSMQIASSNPAESIN